MKRIGFLYDKVVSYENVRMAMEEACRTKKNNKQVVKIHEDVHGNIIRLLKNFHVSGNYMEKNHTDISSGKERTLIVPPYYPDQVVQHSLIRVVEPFAMKRIMPECCCSIKGRGMQYASNLVRRALRKQRTRYYVKFDVKKYFQSVNHEVLIRQLSTTFKDDGVMDLFEEIINSVRDGIPIGNYTSQLLANIYLTPLDRLIKQELRIPFYVRYMDDFVIIGSNKRQLKNAIQKIKSFLKDELYLETHGNECVHDIYKTPIDFCGFKHYKNHTTIRKRIWKKTRRMIIRQTKHLNKRRSQRLMSYFGYIKHSCSYNILVRYQKIIRQSKNQLKKT